jgi:hypothetical protein
VMDDSPARGAVTIRKYKDVDVDQLAALDTRCEMGAAGTESLAFDLLGDPLCRVRHLPAFHMLVTTTTSMITTHPLTPLSLIGA